MWLPLQLEDCKNFRQLHSKTPGHPENFITEGIEVTTGEPGPPSAMKPPCSLQQVADANWTAGPLGQGFCNAVGLAAAEAHLAARYNKSDAPKIVDHYTCALLLSLSSTVWRVRSAGSCQHVRKAQTGSPAVQPAVMLTTLLAAASPSWAMAATWRA